MRVSCSGDVIKTVGMLLGWREDVQEADGSVVVSLGFLRNLLAAERSPLMPLCDADGGSSRYYYGNDYA